MTYAFSGFIIQPKVDLCKREIHFHHLLQKSIVEFTPVYIYFTNVRGTKFPNQAKNVENLPILHIIDFGGDFYFPVDIANMYRRTQYGFQPVEKFHSSSR